MLAVTLLNYSTSKLGACGIFGPLTKQFELSRLASSILREEDHSSLKATYVVVYVHQVIGGPGRSPS